MYVPPELSAARKAHLYLDNAEEGVRAIVDKDPSHTPTRELHQDWFITIAAALLGIGYAVLADTPGPEYDRYDPNRP